MSVQNAPYYPFSQPSSDAKTSKGEKFGYLTAILYLSPATESGLTHKSGAPVNLCPFATQGCMTSCLYTAGRGSRSTGTSRLMTIAPSLRRSTPSKTRR